MGMNPVMVRLGGRRFDSDPYTSNWWLEREGLEGWDDSPDPRHEGEPMPGSDGWFPEGEALVDGREVTLKLGHRAATEEIARGEVQQWAAALAKRTDLVLEVEESFGIRTAQVRVRSRVRTRFQSWDRVQFEIVVGAADPRKYGPLRRVAVAPAGEGADGLYFPLFEDGYLDFGDFEVSGGFWLSNSGTAESWPVHKVRGPIDGFTIVSGADELRFEGEVPLGQEVVLSPYAGGRALQSGVDVSHLLTVADWAPLTAGQIRQLRFAAIGSYGATARLTTEIKDAWW